MAPNFTTGPTNHHLLLYFKFLYDGYGQFFISWFGSFIHVFVYVTDMYYVAAMSQSVNVVRQIGKHEIEEIPCHHEQGGLQTSK